MARTPSVMVALNTHAPDFRLLDTVSGNMLSLHELKGQNATLIAFICNHCPFVKHVNPQLVSIANDYANKGVQIIAISANDVEQYPDDGPEAMTETAKKLGYPFPYLYDQSQETAIAYQAACTPDFFIYDSHLSLAYRGQLDDSRPGNDIPLSGNDIRSALDALVNHTPVSANQKPGIGCNIKWRK